MLYVSRNSKAERKIFTRVRNQDSLNEKRSTASWLLDHMKSNYIFALFISVAEVAPFSADLAEKGLTSGKQQPTAGYAFNLHIHRTYG